MRDFFSVLALPEPRRDLEEVSLSLFWIIKKRVVGEFMKSFQKAIVGVLSCGALIFFILSLSIGISNQLASITDQLSFPSFEKRGLLLEEATVARVVDGDTLVVEQNGEESKVRLIGVDCPESVNPNKEKNTPEGKVASEYTKSLVSIGQKVWLEKDKSDTDRYGRLLRYIWLTEPSTSPTEQEAASNMLNAILVREGHAEPKAYPPDDSWSSLFTDLKANRP